MTTTATPVHHYVAISRSGIVSDQPIATGYDYEPAHYASHHHPHFSNSGFHHQQQLSGAANLAMAAMADQHHM